MAFSNDELLKIISIIEESPYDEVRLEVGDFKLHVQKRGVVLAPRPEASAQIAERTPLAAPTLEQRTAPAVAAAPESSRQPEPEAVPEGLTAVRAPMLGTFYRSPSPGEKPFVELGDRVAADSTVCLVEVMKLFNSVKAGVSGTVVKILAENGAMVEYGKPLLLIEQDLVQAAGEQQ